MGRTLTIFTPTYNRAYTLERLYQSLLRQTSKDFCWIVVDDGSTDNTEQLINTWVTDNKIDITYYRQENQGKPTAHNKGVELTKTELFTCVDSDDYLRDYAVERIIEVWNPLLSYVGILGYRCIEREGVLTKYKANRLKHATLREFYDDGLSGDTILIYKTEVLKKYSFPRFEGEKFVPEVYLYDLIDQDGELLLLPESLYVCKYLPDGYTAHMASVLFHNPKGYFAFINQRLRFDKTIKQIFADSIRYDAMAFAHKRPLRESSRPGFAYLAAVPGVIMYLMRYKKYVNCGDQQ